MNRRRRLARRLLEATAIAAVLAALGAFGVSRGWFAWIQDPAVDRFLFPSAKTDPDIVVVALDEETIARFGWPLPRAVHAQLARQLGAAGAAVVAWDVVFLSSSANTSERPTQLVETTELADALRGLVSSGVVGIVGAGGELVQRPDDALPLLEPVYPPTTEIAGAASVIAHVKTDSPDSEGVVRTVPLVVETADGRFVPSLALASVLAYRGAQPQPVLRPGGVQAGNRFVPTAAGTSLRLNWAEGLDGEARRRSWVSAVDVYDGTADPGRFGGKIVLIGATAELAQDNQKVPVDKSGQFPGVFIHANAINTMLTASYLAPTGTATTVLWIATLAMIAALAVLFLPLWVAALTTLATALAYVLFAIVRFNAGHIMNLVYPLTMLVVAFFAALVVRYFTETRHRQRVSRLFAQYVPAAVAEQLVEEGRVERAAEGERLDVSLFFCDLRGFTAISSTLTPQQVRVMLNEFYDALTEIILERRGTVLKFVGDEVFAVFGAPLAVEHHPQVALECAMAVQRSAPALSEKLTSMGIPAVHFGIGMNTGEVVAAHVGGGRRRQYDIVGDTVNIGSRMCGQAGKGDIVMPLSMYEVLDDPPPAVSMGLVALKNVEAPMELVCIRVDDPDGPHEGLRPAVPDREAPPAPDREAAPVAAPAIGNAETGATASGATMEP